MTQAVINFFVSFPPVIGTLLMAMFPIAERFALPVGITVFHLPVWQAFLLSILGNLVPVMATLFFADKFHEWVSINAGFFSKHWIKVIDHLQKKFARYEKYGLIGLFLFLSIPSPINGVYSASFIAFILGYPLRDSWPYLFSGVVAYNIIALSLTVGLEKIF